MGIHTMPSTTSYQYAAIGTIHSPFLSREGAPIQPQGAKGVRGRVEVLPEYQQGLRDLDGFSHVLLLYHFHLSQGFDLEVVPFLDDQSHGVFATRAPKRPNPIGISLVRLLSVDGATLEVEDVDVLDGTPLLDIKPFVPEFDTQQTVRTGWLAGKAAAATAAKADGRFK
jgi:tRNA-Thr(GGU) m(6)t(6)A37 methyltransferase TsaA